MPDGGGTRDEDGTTVAGVGLLLVVTLAGIGTQLRTGETEFEHFPGTGTGTGTAIAGRQMLADAHISPGVVKPLDVLFEHGGNPQQVADRLRTVDGLIGAVAPATWHAGATALVEAFPAVDGGASGIRGNTDRADAAVSGYRRHGDRRRRGRPGLPARPVRQRPVGARDGSCC